MAEGSARVLEGPCTVVADAGYANGEQIAALGEQGIKCYVASNRSVNNQGQGDLYDRTKFRYDPRQDRYTCPAGQILNRKQINQAQNTVVYAARSQDCGRCAQKPACTHSAQRYISRHLYEPALQANERRLAARPDMMRLRRQTVEHPFGTIKYQILRNARLLVRGLRGARSELSLAVLAYNLKRTINMKGAAWMQAAILAT
jgi:hypothetical protein